MSTRERTKRDRRTAAGADRALAALYGSGADTDLGLDAAGTRVAVEALVLRLLDENEPVVRGWLGENRQEALGRARLTDRLVSAVTRVAVTRAVRDAAEGLFQEAGT